MGPATLSGKKRGSKPGNNKRHRAGSSLVSHPAFYWELSRKAPVTEPGDFQQV
jgi:hypothetical protein